MAVPISYFAHEWLTNPALSNSGFDGGNENTKKVIDEAEIKPRKAVPPPHSNSPNPPFFTNEKIVVLQLLAIVAFVVLLHYIS